jgi:hypothetical protein
LSSHNQTFFFRKFFWSLHHFQRVKLFRQVAENRGVIRENSIEQQAIKVQAG